jgi:hypothetical protein
LRASVDFLDLPLPGRDADAHGFSRVVVERHKEGHRILEGRIANEAVERGRLGQGLSVLEKSLDGESQGFGSHTPSFFEGPARGDASREIGKADAVVGLTGFVQVGDVMHGDHLSFRNIGDDASMISTTMRSRRQTGACDFTFPGVWLSGIIGRGSLAVVDRKQPEATLGVVVVARSSAPRPCV